MNGRLGLGLVALGIFIGVLGGFLLNAETVTTCSTEWTYVTDVGGAFVGDTSDLDEAYDPPANATGWSYLDQFNEGYISAVDYKTADRTNVWRIYTGSQGTAQGTLDVVAEDYSGTDLEPEATVSEPGGRTSTETMPDGFGLHNSAVVTFYVHGDDTEAGAFGTTLQHLLDCITGYDEMGTVTLTVTSSGGYPAFAKVSESTGVVVYRPSGFPSANVAAATFSAVYADPVVKVFRAEGRAEIGGSSCPISDVVLVWGKAQWAGTGTYDADASVSYVGTLAAPAAYMDATKGVSPVEGNYVTEEVVFTHHEGSDEPSLTIDVPGTVGGNNVGLGTSKAVVDIVWSDGSRQLSAVVAEYYVGPQASGASVSIDSGTPVSVQEGPGPLEIVVSIASGTLSVTVNGASAGSSAISSPAPGLSVSAFRLRMSGVDGSTLMDYEATAMADDGSGQEHSYSSGGSSDDWTGSTAYDTWTSQSTTHHFARAYWRNGYSNSSVTMVFAAADGEMVQHLDQAYRNVLAFRGAGGGTLTREISFDPSAGWSVQSVPVGMWPAIELTVSDGKAVARPVQRFGTFSDYDVLDLPTVVYSGTAVPETVQSIEAVRAATGYENIRIAVTSTVTRIDNGGLFLQDASFSVQRSFPDADAVSIMLGSAARMGASITFASASAGTSASLPVDPDRATIYVGGGWQPFNGVTFRWLSSDYGPVSIEGRVFEAAIYSGGQQYDAGAIWAQLKNGKMLKVIDAGDDWTVTLDGVWAPATFLYEGQNIASKSTELADWTHPKFQWSKDDFLIIMMGVSILGGLAGAYFRLVDLWDWTAIIGTVGCLWLFLG